MCRYWLWPLLGALYTLGLFIALVVLHIYSAQLPSDVCLVRDPNGGQYDGCFCEALRPGNVLILQPANSYSCLGFVFIGFAIIGFLTIIHGDKSRITQSKVDRSLLARSPLLMFIYSLTLIFLGIGSMMLHATMTFIGGRLDMISMFCWISFVFTYNLYLIGTSLINTSKPHYYALQYDNITVLGRSDGPVKIGKYCSRWQEIMLVLVVPAAIISLGIVAHKYHIGDYYFGVIVTLSFILELIKMIIRIIAHFKLSVPLNIFPVTFWMWGAVASFIVAFIIWSFSRTGHPLCVPDSIIQGHAIWHILCSVSTGAMFIYFYTEKPLPVLRLSKTQYSQTVPCMRDSDHCSESDDNFVNSQAMDSAA